jgi:hypothetical protein
MTEALRGFERYGLISPLIFPWDRFGHKMLTLDQAFVSSWMPFLSVSPKRRKLCHAIEVWELWVRRC